MLRVPRPFCRRMTRCVDCVAVAVDSPSWRSGRLFPDESMRVAACSVLHDKAYEFDAEEHGSPFVAGRKSGSSIPEAYEGLLRLSAEKTFHGGEFHRLYA